MLLGHEKENILHLPTPIEYLPSVSADLGIKLYIKQIGRASCRERVSSPV